MTYKCLLGNCKTDGLCKPNKDCIRCGFEESENKRRLALIRDGRSLMKNKNGLIYLKVEGHDEI